MLHLSIPYVTLVYRNESHSFLKAVLQCLPFQNVNKLFYMNLPFDDSFSHTPCASHSLVVNLHVILQHCLPFLLSWLYHTLSPFLFPFSPYNMLSISLKLPFLPTSYFLELERRFGKDRMERGSG